MVIDDGGAMGGEGVGLLVWVWVCCHGSGFAVAGCFFFFFLCVLMVDYGLLVVVVSSVCSAAVVGMWRRWFQ